MKGRRLTRVLLFAVALVFFALSTPSPALSAGFPEDGKIIRFIVPTGPGGGFDLYARTLQPFLRKYLPWKKGEIVVENVTGAGFLTGAREIFLAKPDGYTVGTIHTRAVLLPQLLGQVAKFDLAKYTFLGSFGNDPTFIVTRKDHPFLKSLSDMKSAPRPIIHAFASSSGIANYWILKNRMKLNVKPVIGYAGTREAILAVLQGEADTQDVEYSGVASQIKSGEIRPLFHHGDKRTKEAPDVPSLKELGYPEFAGKITVDRSIIAPPGLPKDIAETLEKAVWKALNDPEFIKQNEKGRRLVDPQNGAQARETAVNVITFWNKYEKDLVEEMAKAGYR